MCTGAVTHWHVTLTVVGGGKLHTGKAAGHGVARITTRKGKTVRTKRWSATLTLE